MSGSKTQNPIPLEDVIGSKTKVRILKTLIEADSPLSGRETAKKADLSQRGTIRSLGQLSELGIVHQEVEPGRHNFQINREHFLVQQGLLPLFQAESGLMSTVKRKITESFHDIAGGSLPDLQSLVLLNMEPEDDGLPSIALLSVIRNEAAEYDVIRILRDLSPVIENEFQIALRFLILPLERAKQRLAKGDEVLGDFRSTGEQLLGRPLEDLLLPGASQAAEDGDAGAPILGSLLRRRGRTGLGRR